MKIIYRYLFKELLVVALSTVGVLTCLMVLLNLFKDEFTDMLLNNDVSMWLIGKLIFLLIPFVLTFTLPWGLLMAALIVFGRISQDRELLALKASGIGLAPIVAPAALLGIAFSFISFVINAWIAPECRQSFKNIGYEVVSQNPLAFFVPGQPIDKFPGYRIYIGAKEGKKLKDVHLWQVNGALQTVRSIRAESGELRPDPLGSKVSLILYNVRQEEKIGSDFADVSKVQAGGKARELPFDIPLSSATEKFKKTRSIGVSTLDQIRADLFASKEPRSEATITPMLLELQKRVALACSCFTFILVGVPLAIQTGRRETSVGVALSLGVALAYYFVVVLAEALKKHGDVYPEIIIWAPNWVFQIVGLILLWRVNKK